MTRYLFHGIAAGCIAATAFLFHTHFLPTLYGGLYPLLFALLGWTTLLLRPSLLPLPPLPRIAYGGVAALSAPAAYGLYLLSSRFAFLSNESGALMFIAATVVYLLPAALPLAALGMLRDEPGRPDARASGMLLIGAGIAMAAVLTIFPGAPLYLAALPGMLLPLAAAFLPAPQPLAPVDLSAVTAKKGKKHRSRFPVLLPSLGGYVELLLLLFLAFWIPTVLQWMAEFSPGAGLPGTNLLLLAVAAAGIGLYAGSRLAASPAAAAGSAILLAAAVLALFVIGAGSFDRKGFAVLYSRYYNGIDVDDSVRYALFTLVHLPVFAVAAYSGIIRTRRSAAPDGDRGFHGLAPLAVAAGLLTAMLFGPLLPFWMLVLFISVALLLLAVSIALLELQFDTGHAVFAALLLAAAVPLAVSDGPTFTDLFAPQRFQVTAEVRSPAGRMTMLRARDYDDPFYTVFWNETQALTQSSRGVQNALYRMGHLPMLLAPKHERVLLLGLGSSLPVEAVQMHRPGKIVCVEPNAAMLRLSDSTRNDHRERRYMRGVELHNERVEAYASRERERFDVIISAEPLAVSAPSVLPFTPSYYGDIAGLLSDDGIFAQWLPLHRLGTEGVWRAARSMMDAFGHVELWIATPDPDNLMIGLIAAKHAAPDYGRVAPHLAPLMSDQATAFHMRQIQFSDPAVVLSLFGMDAGRLKSIAGGAKPFDGWAMLPPEPPMQEAPGIAANFFQQRSLSPSVLAAVPDSLGSELEALYPQRQAVFSASLAVLTGDDSTAVRALLPVLGTTAVNLEARRCLSDILQRQAAGYVGMQKYQTALDVLTRVLALTPVNTYTLRMIMIAAMQTGDRDLSVMAIDGIKRINPAHAGYRDNQATIRAQEGAVNDALLLYETATTLDPSNEEIYCNMASFHYSQGRVWEAVRVLDMATERAYYPAKAYFLKGGFYAESGKAELAMEAYEGYLRTARPGDPYENEIQGRIAALKPYLP